MYREDVLLALGQTIVVAGIAGVVAIVVYLALTFRADFVRTITPERIAAAASAAFVFGAMGIVIGLTMGSSRTPVVATIVPATLTFIGSVALYLITREKADPVVVAPAVACFSLLMFTGTALGAYERGRSSVQAELNRYNLDLLTREADVEQAINIYRKTSGLPPLTFAPLAAAATDAPAK